jgi:peptidoglycan/LPS O-acetylase OafA/YrhL
VLAVSALALALFGIGRFTQSAEFSDAFATSRMWPLLLTNVTLIGQDIFAWFNVTPDYHFVADLDFKNAAHDGVAAWHYLLIPQSWSLAFELMFYAMAPFITKRSIPFIAGLALASLAFRLAGHFTDLSYNLWPRRLFPAELCLFLFGVLAYRLRGYMNSIPGWTGWPVLVLLLGLISLHARLSIDSHITWALMYCTVALALPVLFKTFATLKWDVWIGQLSYPFYIVHILALGIVSKGGGLFFSDHIIYRDGHCPRGACRTAARRLAAAAG